MIRSNAYKQPVKVQEFNALLALERLRDIAAENDDWEKVEKLGDWIELQRANLHKPVIH